MGLIDGDEGAEPLVTSRQFIKRLEMLTDLCVYNPNRIVVNDQARKRIYGNDEEANEFLNLSELRQEWDNEDPRVTEDDEKIDHKNQTLLRNLQA